MDSSGIDKNALFQMLMNFGSLGQTLNNPSRPSGFNTLTNS